MIGIRIFGANITIPAGLGSAGWFWLKSMMEYYSGFKESYG
jgi:hypothetical protein